MNLRARVEKLETAGGRQSERVLYVFQDCGETEADVMARWQADNPGQSIADARLRVTVVRWADAQPEAVTL
jgi:hypothetical protein